MTPKTKKFSWTLLALILIGAGVGFDILGGILNLLPDSLTATSGFMLVFLLLNILQLLTYLAALGFAIVGFLKDKQHQFPIRLLVLIVAGIGALSGILGVAAAAKAQTEFNKNQQLIQQYKNQENNDNSDDDSDFGTGGA